MKQQYELTLNDYIELNVAFARKSKAMKRLMRSQQLIFPFGGLVYVCINLFAQQPLPSIFYVIIGAICAGWFFYYPKIHYNWVRKRARKSAEAGQNHLVGKHSVQLQQECLVLNFNGAENRINYKKIERIEDDGNYLFIYLSEKQVSILPKQPLPEELITTIKERQQAAVAS